MTSHTGPRKSQVTQPAHLTQRERISFQVRMGGDSRWREGVIVPVALQSGPKVTSALKVQSGRCLVSGTGPQMPGHWCPPHRLRLKVLIHSNDPEVLSSQRAFKHIISLHTTLEERFLMTTVTDTRGPSSH